MKYNTPRITNIKQAFNNNPKQSHTIHKQARPINTMKDNQKQANTIKTTKTNPRTINASRKQNNPNNGNMFNKNNQNTFEQHLRPSNRPNAITLNQTLSTTL